MAPSSSARPASRRASSSVVMTLTSAALSSAHCSTVRTLWPTSRPMSHRNATRVSMTAPPGASGGCGTSSRMSMSEQGCSSPRPYPPAATRAHAACAAQCVRHASRSAASMSAARACTRSSTGSSATKRAFSSSCAWRSSSRQAAGPASAASCAGSRATSGQGAAGYVAGRVSSSSSESEAPIVRGLMLRPVRAQRQHVEPGVGDQHGVFPLRRQRVVLGDDGPAVGQQAHVTLARVHHRLDGEGHTRLQLEPGAGLAVVQHLRVFVIHTPDAMAAVLAHHRVVVLLDEALDGMTDIAQVRTRTYRLDAAPHGGEAGLGEALRVRGRLAHQVHAAGVAVKSVGDHGDVDIDDVAGLQALVIRDAVADHVVYRGADGLGETAVVEVRGHRAPYLPDAGVAWGGG